ncbi:MAG TPA: vitamin K epoxide reductase family protein [Gemmatimonadales bacterium]|nr:vitamin K epoxide reductase family protein [Gemmatimonadales bacterium]
MKHRMAVGLLSLAGFFLALYLYLYKIGLIGTLACGTGGCETVQMSPWSRFLGVEVALYGVIGYALLFGLALVSLQAGEARRHWSDRLVLLGAGAGVLFTAYLTSLELFVIHAICRWCVGSAAIITSIFVVAFMGRRAAAGTTG